MFEKAEDEYNSLMSKKNVIEVGALLSIIEFCLEFEIFLFVNSNLF